MYDLNLAYLKIMSNDITAVESLKNARRICLYGTFDYFMPRFNSNWKRLRECKYV